MRKEVTYVLIPADSSAPLKELKLKFRNSNVVPALMDELKKHFAKGQKLEARKKALAKELEGKIDDQNVLDFFSNQTMCGQVPLKPPTRDGTENGYTSVSMYVDDNGIANNLPANPRAQAVAALCGVQVNVFGDAFIARVFDDDKDDFRRLDFKLSECSSDADWVKEGRAIRLEKQKRESDSSAAQSSNTSSSGYSLQHRCSLPGCLGTNAQMRCGRCRKVSYCSKDCQRKHWKKGHKKVCTPAPAPQTSTTSTEAAPAPAATDASPSAPDKPAESETKKSEASESSS